MMTFKFFNKITHTQMFFVASSSSALLIKEPFKKKPKKHNQGIYLLNRKLKENVKCTCTLFYVNVIHLPEAKP